MTHFRSSRQRYRRFREDYRQGRVEERATIGVPAPTPAQRPSRQSRREYLRAYVRWLRPHRFAIATIAVVSLSVAGLQLTVPLFMRFAIDRVLLNKDLDATARLIRFHLAGVSFLTLLLFVNGMSVLRECRLRRLNLQVVLSLRRALFERLLQLPLPTLSDMKTGGILSRLSGDVDTTTALLQMGLIAPAVGLARLLAGLTALTVLNWRLALLASAVVSALMVPNIHFSRRVRPLYRSLRRDAERIDGRVAEAFAGIRVVRAFGREMRELIEYMVGRHTMVRTELFAHRREVAVWASWDLVTMAVNVVIIWYGGYLNVIGKATIGDIIAFQWYALMLLAPATEIVNSLPLVQRSLASVERVFDVLAMPRDKPDPPDAGDAPAVVRELRFERVEFEYRAGRPVVREFDLAVPAGSVVALVGRSGAGKTTVTDLVARFHDPTRGRILLNGIDIRAIRLRTYRALLALVQQETFLFDGSVRDNIAYGRRDASDAEIEDAARRANAHEFIVQLPEQYDTMVGERGVKLSGGQCQRLAIARAFLASPQILILDEATSNLDTESEQLIQASMATLFAGRTTFVIAHRLSTIRRADLILLMEDGRVIERGTHEALMRARGVYREMVQRQMHASDARAATVVS